MGTCGHVQKVNLVWPTLMEVTDKPLSCAKPVSCRWLIFRVGSFVRFWFNLSVDFSTFPLLLNVLLIFSVSPVLQGNINKEPDKFQN